jgi:ADP-ribose pyrophosphatase YjhB (NUDIX family)
VIAVDPANRLLLLRHDSRHHGLHWAAPGGGLEDGEDFQAGAARELREETGWQDVVIEPDVVLEDARVQGPESRFSKTVHKFFVARVSIPRRPVADVDGMHASDGILDYRWWTLAELESTTETIWPPGLLPVVRGLVG